MSNPKNIFTDSDSIKTVDLHRIVYLFLSILFFFLTEVGRHVYRPYIYSNHIDDYGIADSIGNSGGIIVQIFFMLAILNSKNKKVFRVITFVVIGYILYEFLQPYLPKGVFDWLDVYGTFIGGVIAMIIYFLITLLVRNKVYFKF